MPNPIKAYLGLPSIACDKKKFQLLKSRLIVFFDINR